MKTIILAVLLTVVANVRCAETTSAPPAADLAVLERFLNLSDAELQQMADAIARVRAMTPEQRAVLQRELLAFRQLPAAEREQIRAGWGWMPPEIQTGWRAMMQSLTAEQRAEVQAKLQSLPPAEKTQYRRRLVDQYLREHPAR